MPIFVEGCWYPSNLIQIIKSINSEPPKPMTKPEFKFEMNAKAAQHNWTILKKYNLNLKDALKKDELQDVMYGTCLLRVIHQIVEYRSRHPDKKILIQKIDFKSAY